MLVENLGLERDLSRNPLFDTLFVLQNTERSNLNIPGLTFLPFEFENNVVKFDLALSAYEVGDKISCKIEYRTSLFKKESIERLAEHFIQIADEVVSNPEMQLAEVETITEDEKQRLLDQFNQTTREYPFKTVQQLFEEQVKRTPDEIALILEKDKMTYQELNRKANELAYRLREKGVKPNQVIGMMVHRSFEMLIGIIGILKAGGAYLPIDPTYPEERIGYMMDECGVGLLLTQSDLITIVKKVDSVEMITIDSEQDGESNSNKSR